MSFIFLRNRVTGGAAFTPASLFSSGEEGAWYEPSPTTCFTDTAGTTAASVGDAVARINDLSGNGNHATQATAAARPLLQQTAGGLYYLAFDGADSLLVSGMSATAGPVTITGAFDISSNSVYEYIIDIETGRLVFAARAVSLANSGVYNGAAWTGTPTSLSTPYVMTGLMRTSGSLRLNGSEAATFAMTQRAIGGSIGIGSAYDGLGAHFDGNLYGLIVRAADTTGTDLTNTESYLAAKSGVTL